MPFLRSCSSFSRPLQSHFGCQSLAVSTSGRSSSQRSRVTRAALFGWDPLLSKEEQARRREEQIQAQQEVLKRRRGNSWQKSVNERRAEVVKYATDKEYKKKVDDERRKKKPKQEDPGLSGIIIPLPPFGNSEMDGGERFDLRSEWIDEGWSDPTDNPFKAFGRLFGIGKNDKTEKDWRAIELERRANKNKNKKK
ncbi:hypothetical protein WJX73_002881 [Symbiochloris irregularis]|uniref:Uncharacterized protein n=1 Tax=Symbiochloris irregularis TaxID=706552 RepID=A0AAW1PE64_9CHLO